MTWTLSLPRLAGIETRVHASFALLLLWVGADSYRSTGSWTGAIFGVVFVLLMFGAVLLHELGHALTARRFGVPTRAITLYPIGGVAELLGHARTPGQDALIAVAGPAVNFVLAAGLALVAWLAPLTPGPAFFVNALVWANLGLGLFNLLPAFPMDGGRILRAGLTSRLGRLRATEIAVGLGRLAAVGLAVWGLYSSMWYLLIAAVLWSIGGRELRHAQWMHAARTNVGRVNPAGAATTSGRFFRVEVVDPNARRPGSRDDPFFVEHLRGVRQQARRRGQRHED